MHTDQYIQPISISTILQLEPIQTLYWEHSQPTARLTRTQNKWSVQVEKIPISVSISALNWKSFMEAFHLKRARSGLLERKRSSLLQINLCHTHSFFSLFYFTLLFSSYCWSYWEGESYWLFAFFSVNERRAEYCSSVFGQFDITSSLQIIQQIHIHTYSETN